MSDGQWQIEMLWRCASCDHRNLGRSTVCGQCGKPKTGHEEYEMPSDTSRAAAVTDASLLRVAQGGANWRCRYCGSDQRRHDDTCAQCGAAQREGSDLGAIAAPDAAGRVLPSPPLAAPRPARPAVPLLAFLLALPVVLLIFSSLLWRLLWRAPSPVRTLSAPTVTAAPVPTTRELQATVAGVDWEQRVQVERYQLLDGEGFLEAKPADATALKKAGQRVHHHDQVPDGFMTETYTVEVPDGYRTETYTETVPDGTTTETYTEQEPCGETCTTGARSCRNVCTSGKNGFASCKEVCTGGTRTCSPKYCTRTRSRQVPRTRSVTRTRQVPRTRQETRTRQVPRLRDVPRYAEWYVWKSWGWKDHRTLSATGTTGALRWPSDAEVALGQRLARGEQERARRDGTYRLHLQGEDGARYEVTARDADDFQRRAGASSLRVQVDGAKVTLLDP